MEQLVTEVPKRPPPTFKNPKLWSAGLVDFVRLCLIKEWEDRPTSLQLAEVSQIQVQFFFQR